MQELQKLLDDQKQYAEDLEKPIAKDNAKGAKLKQKNSQGSGNGRAHEQQSVKIKRNQSQREKTNDRGFDQGNTEDSITNVASGGASDSTEEDADDSQEDGLIETGTDSEACSQVDTGEELDSSDSHSHSQDSPDVHECKEEEGSGSNLTDENGTCSGDSDAHDSKRECDSDVDGCQMLVKQGIYMICQHERADHVPLLLCNYLCNTELVNCDLAESKNKVCLIHNKVDDCWVALQP